MAYLETHHSLAQWIRHYLESGFQMDCELIESMQAAFGISDPEALLADVQSSEVASFLELLFYPDRRVKNDFEARWGHVRFTAEAVAAALSELTRAPITAAIRVAGRNDSVFMTVPDFAVSGFVHRLNITWYPPDSLDRVLATRLDGPSRFLVRSCLRHARVPWHPNQTALVELFLSSFPINSDDFEPCLAFLLSILGELGPDDEPFAFLTARKFFFFQALCKAESFERRRQAGNMEILILQGDRAAHGNADQWRTQMHRVDRICHVLFGHTRFFQQPLERQLEMHAGKDSRQIARLMRIIG